MPFAPGGRTGERSATKYNEAQRSGAIGSLPRRPGGLPLLILHRRRAACARSTPQVHRPPRLGISTMVRLERSAHYSSVDEWNRFHSYGFDNIPIEKEASQAWSTS
ncbi:hypothetical protein [Burkholderia sp. ABCPW 111]|uniref:hypothetical protein n=1 Tax=Burkholderia sp. ABCPW 111 TaxID=1820025 RepID=UPI00126A1E91|nr:hypothetical protein [Burkholderia sp. ABCPW 111]